MNLVMHLHLQTKIKTSTLYLTNQPGNKQDLQNVEQISENKAGLSQEHIIRLPNHHHWRKQPRHEDQKLCTKISRFINNPLVFQKFH